MTIAKRAAVASWSSRPPITPTRVQAQQGSEDGSRGGQAGGQAARPSPRDQVAQRRRGNGAGSRARMMAAVPTADVIVTNPTHFSVALRYEAGTARAHRGRQGC